MSSNFALYSINSLKWNDSDSSKWDDNYTVPIQPPYKYIPPYQTPPITPPIITPPDHSFEIEQMKRQMEEMAKQMASLRGEIQKLKKQIEKMKDEPQRIVI